MLHSIPPASIIDYSLQKTKVLNPPIIELLSDSIICNFVISIISEHMFYVNSFRKCKNELGVFLPNSFLRTFFSLLKWYFLCF